MSKIDEIVEQAIKSVDKGVDCWWSYEPAEKAIRKACIEYAENAIDLYWQSIETLAVQDKDKDKEAMKILDDIKEHLLVFKKAILSNIQKDE